VLLRNKFVSALASEDLYDDPPRAHNCEIRIFW